MVDFVPGYNRIQDDNPIGSVFGPMMDVILAQGCATHWTTLTANTGVTNTDHGRGFDLDGWTLQLDPAATLTSGWRCFALGPGVIDPNDGPNVILQANEWAFISTNASETFIMKAQRGPSEIVKTADESVASDTTLSDDAALLFPVLANTKYRFKFTIHYDTPTAADFKFDVNGPASPTLVDIFTKAIAPGASALSISHQTAFAFTAVTLTETSGTSGFIEIEGILHNGANAGNVSFRWAQNTSNASNTTVRAGSRVEFAIAQ